VKISVDIPAGVNNDSVISIRGQGEPGMNGGVSGDMYVVLNVKPHKLFERRGHDLWLEIPITFNQAVLGDEITVPTLEEKVSYKVPSGTQTGTVFRLKGKGIKTVRGNRKGDLYVRVILEVPTRLSGKQKKAIEEMGKIVTNESYSKKSRFLDSVKEFFS
jgi:molecular chaperone DnaJ